MLTTKSVIKTLQSTGKWLAHPYQDECYRGKGHRARRDKHPKESKLNVEPSYWLTLHVYQLEERRQY
ncbi:hypothetical protein SCLCIDRAFT_1221782 [Scleroderma citrinum Foug A]|uniref:Uncharacterized protein n=1 Tax=Scleroderma citrinum Foug A TaxID=1036808 RepID=A0A0C3DEF5_9AGAM|nr:hypothetical protein SCLCIDRAFT_1221782 [Scleroderma citrinum Foug A]